MDISYNFHGHYLNFQFYFEIISGLVPPCLVRFTPLISLPGFTFSSPFICSSPNTHRLPDCLLWSPESNSPAFVFLFLWLALLLAPDHCLFLLLPLLLVYPVSQSAYFWLWTCFPAYGFRSLWRGGLDALCELLLKKILYFCVWTRGSGPLAPVILLMFPACFTLHYGNNTSC